MSEFVKAALIRALRTFCQTAVATIGTTALISEVNWLMVLSTAGLAAILSLLNSVATGLPEAPVPQLTEPKKEEPKGDKTEVPEEKQEATDEHEAKKE